MTLEEIESVQSFVQNMDKLELPNQLVAVLADPLLQKLLVLRPSTESYQRVANWLNSVLQDVIDGDADEATLWEVLEVVRDFVVQTKVRDEISVTDFFFSVMLIKCRTEPAIVDPQLLCALLSALERDRQPQLHLCDSII